MSSRRRFRPAVVPALARLWRDEKALSTFSALLLVVIFVIPPFLAPGSGRRLAGDLAYALLLISGVWALGEGKAARWMLLPVAVAALLVDLGSWLWPVPKVGVLSMQLLSLLLFLAVVLGQTLRAGRVTLHRILGAVAAYLLLGILWAHAYALVAHVRPGAFSGPLNLDDGPRAFLYFSFVTITTVGYGDVLPLHPAARSLAMLEAVTGPLYLAILVARLVSLTVGPGEEPR
jgi:hypothetical protein